MSEEQVNASELANSDPLIELGIAMFKIWPEIAGRNSLFYEVAHPLMRIYERAEMGESLAGDSFKARRILLSLNRRELIRLLFEYGRMDEKAAMPWQLKLVNRPDTKEIKERNKRIKTASKKSERETFEDTIVVRVTKYRKAQNANLVVALDAVAKALDDADAPLPNTSKNLGLANVRAAYMAGMKRAKPRGYAIERRGMFAPRVSKIYFGSLTKKGRPKRVMPK